MKINKDQLELLWGDGGPYSEAKIIINTRILDDQVSRVMVEVEANINPTTFRIIKMNKNKFLDDPPVMQILEHAEYIGKENGYHVDTGMAEVFDENSMIEAQRRLNYSKDAIIRMHKFVMEYLNIDHRYINDKPTRLSDILDGIEEL